MPLLAYFREFPKEPDVVRAKEAPLAGHGSERTTAASEHSGALARSISFVFS